ncbi:hypothetical protein IV203_008464 [Nitzschia inconspicua]|uniref:Uncharacterized protein n=1 Tax=Nitzschia inconspicua TaxID=303405 RepID=A0A9K3KZ91_9STRA|nr:hypothetical protein IV203_008464 [Nitzschia inconspicua]
MTDGLGDGGSSPGGSAPQNSSVEKGNDDRRDGDRDAKDSFSFRSNNNNNNPNPKTKNTSNEVFEGSVDSLKGRAGEFRKAFNPDRLHLKPLIEPEEPDDDASNVVIELWKHKLKRLKTDESWEKIDDESNAMALLRLLRSVLHTGPGKKSCHNVKDALQRYFSFKQHGEMSLREYYDLFRNHVEAVEYLGGDIGLGEKFIKEFTDGKGPFEFGEKQY